MAIELLNPATEELVKSFNPMSEDEVGKIIEDVHNDFLGWRTTTFVERKKLMLNAANILRSEKQKYAEILTLEMGKPITQAIAEVEKCVWVCEYYAENAEEILSKEFIPTEASESYVQFDPIGIILAVMPWNFPYWQVFRFAAPALMAGNAGLHSVWS